ncbi:MAG: formylglycine-generating enzyme family protein [Mycobacteriales bacterium]
MSSCCAPSGSRSSSSPERAAWAGTGRPGSLVDVPGGGFLMGYEGPLANQGEGEGPVRRVELPAYRIAPTTVTNQQFAGFVRATGYVTEAERSGWSFVFSSLVSDEQAVRGRVSGAEWWCAVTGATWRTPHGPGSEPLPNHPVVHVSADDAEAYCAWGGTRLPSEAEWERAARGGLEGAIYPWGDKLTPGGQQRCNIWQGEFPVRHTGRVGTQPVKSFKPNGFGLYQASGNVWEWTASPWEGSDRRVRRGGSYLCHASYCNRYRVAARDSSHPADTTGNIGFRVAA